MVSCGPYTESMNYRYMFNIPDIRGPLPRNTVQPGSLTAIITENPDFSRFSYMLNLAKLELRYDDIQANFTVFVPSDQALAHIPEEVFIGMDSLTARDIIQSSTLNKRITSEILADSPASYFYPLNRINRLFITNISGKTYLNNSINIIKKDIIGTNGIIHVIDALIWPLIV